MEMESTGSQCTLPKILGAIHLTEITGLRFQNFLGAHGSRQVRNVLFYSNAKRVSHSFKMVEVWMLDHCC